MGKEIVTEVQEALRVPYRINPRRNILRRILIKLTKANDKDKTLKAKNNIQSNLHKVISGFPSRNSSGQKGVARYI